MGHRKLLRTCLVAVCAVLLTPLLGVSAASAQAYLFWGYYHWNNTEWEFASTGPDGATPKDGSVEGWRFAAAGDDTPPRLPRADGDFELICGQTEEPAEGQKRVAVVVDYGVSEEAPEGTDVPPARGECAVVPADATGADVLAAAASVRAENALVCGVDDYPATGCGGESDIEPAVDADTPVELELPEAESSAEPEAEGGADADSGGGSEADTSSTAEPTDGGIGRFGVLVAALIALVLLVVLGGVMGVRRRSR